jgi:hypothetical protein
MADKMAAALLSEASETAREFDHIRMHVETTRSQIHFKSEWTWDKKSEMLRPMPMGTEIPHICKSGSEFGYIPSPRNAR